MLFEPRGFKLEAPIGSLKILKEIMKPIEETFVRTDEYLLVKTEILIKANEWKETNLTFKGMSKSGEMIQESWMERITIIQVLINEHEQKERRNRLISYSNCISKNLFENEEKINKTTTLMWNRDYQEAIDEACKIWTKIMVISKSELIFAKTKVLQIMIESTLNITLSDTREAEKWLDDLKKLDYNGIMTAILDLKMMIRKEVEKDYICKQFKDTLKRIGIIEDSMERNDWYSQMNNLKEYYRELYNETVTIEIPEAEIPYPTNIRQTLFSHQDNPENVIVIREEQDAKNLHEKVQKMRQIEDQTKPKATRKANEKKKIQKKKLKKMKRHQMNMKN
jgi:hypothetical protein